MSFPFSKQHDTMLCGVACLSMICRYYGNEESSKYLLNCCRPTSEGVSMLTLNDAAIALGFRAVCARISPSKLVQNSFPCILHWNQNHFVVIYKVKKGRKFYIADPGKGLVYLQGISKVPNFAIENIKRFDMKKLLILLLVFVTFIPRLCFWY